MNVEEIGKFLGRVAYSDNRTVDTGLILHWEDMLPVDVTYDEAMDALRHHRHTSTAYLSETHIIHHVHAARAAAGRDRLARVGEPPWPAGLEHAQERAWHRAWMDAVKAGALDPVRYADAAIGYRRTAEQLTARPDRVQQIAALAGTKASSNHE